MDDNRDYKFLASIPKTECYWEPCGNFHYLTTCGELVYMPTYKEQNLNKCKFCNKKLYDDGYNNK